MSYYKDQLKEWLRDKEVQGDFALSVGNMHDDRKYFKAFSIGLMETLDVDEEYKPTKVADVNDPEWLANDLDWWSRRKDHYDHIFTFELWEYVWNPYQALKDFNHMLKQGGKLWVSAPFVYPTHNPTEQDFLRYTEAFWKIAAPKMGFKVVEYQKRVWRDSSGFLESVHDDGMRPAKDYIHNITGHLVILEKL